MLSPTQTTEYKAPAFPHEFIGILIEAGTDTLAKWLKASGAPKAVLDAVSALDCLHYYEGRAAIGSTSRIEDEFAKDSVAELTTAIAQLGGTFHDGISISNEREPIKWAPAAALGEWLAMYDRLSDEDRQEARAWMRELIATEQARAVDHSGR